LIQVFQQGADGIDTFVFHDFPSDLLLGWAYVCRQCRRTGQTFSHAPPQRRC
jgi:hypothetical protein